MTTGNPLFDNMPPAVKAGWLAAHQAAAAQAGATPPAASPGQIPLPGAQQAPQKPVIASQGTPVANPKPLAAPAAPPVSLGHQIAQTQANVNAPMTPEIAKPLALPGAAAPAMPSAQMPSIKAPRGTVEGDENERGRLLQSGSGISQIAHRIENSDFGQNHPTLSKILGYGAQGAATVGDMGLRMANPLVEQMTPGTEGHHQLLVNQAGKQLTADEANREKEAQVAGQQATTAATQAEVPLREAQTEAAKLIEITPELAHEMGNPALAGQSVTQGAMQHLLTTAGTNQTKVQTTGMTVQGKQDVAAANNLTKEKVATLKPEQRDDRAIRLMEKPPEARTQEENAYLGAYAKWVDQTKTQPGVTRMMALAQFRPVQILGPDGDVHYDYSGHAIQSGAATPGSMNFQTAKSMAKFMTSGKGGGVMTAYRTASDHLDLLKEAMVKLQNGDVQGLNQLNNSFKQQFGSAAPTNVNAIKAMLAGELANVAKVSGATDQEIQEQKENINRASSPEQLSGLVETNQDLMDQKAQEMFSQYQSGMQGQPVFAKGGIGRNAAAPANAQSQGSSSGLGVSLKDAMALPQNKGKSADDVRTDIQAHGHSVVE